MKCVIQINCVLQPAACTTVDPYTREGKASNTARGTGIGAVAGTVLGAATSNHKDCDKGAVIAGARGGAGHAHDTAAGRARNRHVELEILPL